ncbi:UDP-2,4-diacetamido-2,4,6-trideoxy-beta-L-altropyranose hydrolase [Candidatus Enterovibrio altilux]|uniref:Pseudaminic acid cytidylyltransferase n=1 Tax=Candidatus Enterovibrio altilux TaxID=1927128 RepID=A0A291B7M7_9GAMM|nr:UDP-2,4-diacetamido-2,4,6-trideoxy-beta-L-altropyranose hydrolase [Candidatus Enterovibrio luxaltus]ATF09001.1 Pseudaminic acid cytidylyltransferase [Candidatus Enterovibrio luxaltus]
MNVMIRVDASEQIGTGHIMRCLVLSKKLLARNHTVTILSRALKGNLIDYCCQQGISTVALPTIEKITASNYNDYQPWLRVNQKKDARQCLTTLKEASFDWIVCDHYALDTQWQSLMKRHDTKLLAIDDLANRQHNCDILFDHNPWPNFKNRYHSLIPPSSQRLLGLKFALLRDSFIELKNIHEENIKNQVIVFFSGSDPTGECLKFLTACQCIPNLPFQVVLIYGISNPRKTQLLEKFLPPFITLVKNIPEFETQLAHSRYAFGGVGVSAIERTYLRLPSTLVSVAENQREMAEHLANSGLYRYLGLSNNITPFDYTNELTWLVEHWNKLPWRLPESDIDGNGANRVVKAMEAAS